MALIMGYVKISWATSIFHQVALLATMCFCLISTPGSGGDARAYEISSHESLSHLVPVMNFN